MNIPYTVETRPDTGLANGKLGIWLFLASEVMLFGALFSTYIILRVTAPVWPHGADELSVPLGAINTVILISSSVTMVMAWATLKMNDFAKHRLYLIATFVLAGIFLVNKYFEYSDHLSHGEGPWHSTYLAIYFTLTGLHGLHVLGGMVVNSYFWGPGSKLWKTDPEHFTNRVENAGLFWHFVDLVWIFLFPVLYLL
jgi:heme/copper-type cytochrome/quinol oxidase subunit 3